MVFQLRVMAFQAFQLRVITPNNVLKIWIEPISLDSTLKFFPYLLTFCDGVGRAVSALDGARVQSVQLLARPSHQFVATLDQSHRQLTHTLDTDTVCCKTDRERKQRFWINFSRQTQSELGNKLICISISAKSFACETKLDRRQLKNGFKLRLLIKQQIICYLFCYMQIFDRYIYYRLHSSLFFLTFVWEQGDRAIIWAFLCWRNGGGKSTHV